MKDDKKKLVIVGVLALVVVCVGVFQFTAAPAPAPAPVAAEEEKKKEEEAKKAEEAKLQAEEAPNPLFVAALDRRDPFAPGKIDAPKPDPIAPTPPEPRPAAERLPDPRRSRRNGNVPAVPKFDRINTAGGADVLPSPNGGGGINLSPIEDKFSYTLGGVIIGARPAAVFNDAQGNQRLVPVGGSLDGDTKLVEVTRNSVVLKHRGRTIELTTGGNQSAK